MSSRWLHSAARGARAFTLLEVMVAVAILGLGLTVILTAQTGLFSSSKRAGQLSEAVGLARCKMSEIEEELLRKGYQLTKDEDEGPCCDDEESELRCRWSVIPVTLPDLSTAGLERDAGAGESESVDDPTAAMGKLGEAEASLGSGDTAAAMEELGGSSASGLASMAVGMVYPQLKGMLEASIRKVTVKVYWKDGSAERDLSVTQYVTNPQQGGMLAEGEGGAGNLPTP